MAQRFSGYAMTYVEVGQVMGLSRTRIYQLEKSAMRKLRRHPEVLENLRALASARDQSREYAKASMDSHD